MALLELIRQPPPNSLSSLPEGAAGIRATLAAMMRAARIGASTLEVRELAQRIVAHVAARDYSGELVAIQQWVKNNIRYTQDPVGAEMLKDPVALINDPFGDCDDMATLVAALAMSIGFPSRFVAIGTSEVGVFEHVYAEVLLGTVWLSVETTEPVRVGWIPENVKARMIRHI